MNIKKTLISLMLLAWVAVSAQAQQFNVTTTQQLRLHLKEGGVRVFDIAQLDSIDFNTQTDTTWLGLPPLSIDVPTSWAQSRVAQVVYQGQKVAELCLEYIKSQGAQRVVAYPADSTGRAQLDQGLSASDGGTVVWDTVARTVAYTPGSQPLQRLYLVNGRLQAQAAEGALPAQVSPERLVDQRGTEELSYPIVKIGTQYWMAENLATECYRDGTPIAAFTATQTTAWNANTTGAVHVYADSPDYLSVYGRLYNGYAVLSDQGLAPEGWRVPTIDEWRQLRSYGGAAAAGYKSDVPLSWLNDGEGTNLTGFDALPGGYYTSGTGDSAEGQDAYFWSSTSFYDILTRSNGLEYFRLNCTAQNSIYSTESGHAYQFGHSVRCVRK